MIVGWLGPLFGWNTTHHFSFKLTGTYTISKTQQSFQKWSPRSPKYVSNANYVPIAFTSHYVTVERHYDT